MGENIREMNYSGGHRRSWRKDWRPFEDAREFVRGLGIKRQEDWAAYAASGQKPDDIPSKPQDVYRAKWRGFGDWLGSVKAWNRTALLAFLEDLRPHLPHLEERELYLNAWCELRSPSQQVGES